MLGLRRHLDDTLGPVPIDTAGGHGDPGACGPGSPSWAVLGDLSAIVGGVRALLVQMCHPQAMAGVFAHSTYTSDPLGRLQRTTGYVTVATFGHSAELIDVTRRVRAAHSRVAGTTRDGTAYRADQPDLLAWISVALTASLLETHRLLHPAPLDGDAQDRFVLEQSRLAALLDPRFPLDGDATYLVAALREGQLDQQLPLLADGLLPHSRTSLDAALGQYAGRLRVGSDALSAYRFLSDFTLSEPRGSVYRVLFAAASASLDEHTRTLLRLSYEPQHQQRDLRRCRQALNVGRLLVGASRTLPVATRRAVSPADLRQTARR
jgi:uncharacterized protein (DUF2236 family)